MRFTFNSMVHADRPARPRLITRPGRRLFVGAALGAMAVVRRQVCWAWDCFWRRVAWAWRGPAFSRVVSVLVSGQRAFDVKRERTLPCLLG